MTTNPTTARIAFDKHVAQLEGFPTAHVVGMAYRLADDMKAARGTAAHLADKRRVIARAADAIEKHLSTRSIEAIDCLDCVCGGFDPCDSCNARGFTFTDLDLDIVFTLPVGGGLDEVEGADR